MVVVVVALSEGADVLFLVRVGRGNLRVKCSNESSCWPECCWKVTCFFK